MAHKYFIPEFKTLGAGYLYHRIIERRDPIPNFPRKIQIQTMAGCNARCVFCPNGKTDNPIPVGKKMDVKLYERIIDEVCDNSIERISPYLQNEPFLDPDISARVAYITKRKRKGQYSKLTSHGGLMTERQAKGILDAGLDRISFSVHGIEPEAYSETMVGLKLNKVLENIDRLIELKRAGNYRKPRIHVTMLKTKVLEPQLPAIRKYWGDRKIKINIRGIENRGHHKSVLSDQLTVKGMKAFDWCRRMFEQVYVFYDGKLLQCCVDWERSTNMGDLNQHTLKEIWNSELYGDYRRRFLVGDVKDMLCMGCSKENVDGDDADD